MPSKRTFRAKNGKSPNHEKAVKFIELMLKEPEPSKRDPYKCCELAGYKPRTTHLKKGQSPYEARVRDLMSDPIILLALAGRQADNEMLAEYGPDEIVKRLVMTAQSCLKDYCEWDERGIKLFSSARLSRAKAQNILKLKQTVNAAGSITMNIELINPMDAIDKLMRKHGMYKDSLKLEDTLKTELEEMTEDEIKEQLYAILAANPDIAQDVANVANNILAARKGK